MDNYKGLFYNNNKQQKFYEGGAHFRYKDLFKVLKILGGIIAEKEYVENCFIENKNIDNNLNINKKKSKQKEKTRNINQFNYANNPNTQITINKNNTKKNIYNITGIGFIKSRNIPSNFGFEETNKNYNKTNTTIFNYNQKSNIRNSIIKNFLKNRNIENNEEKINTKNIFLNHLKYTYNINRKYSHNKIFAVKNVIYPKNNNRKYSDIINSNYNNNHNKAINSRNNNNSITNGNKELNYLKEKFSNSLAANGLGLNHSRNLTNKNMFDYGKTFDYKDMKSKGNININNFIDQGKNNKALYNMKNCSSGINMNNYTKKSVNKKIVINGNLLYVKNYMNNNNNNEKNFKNNNDLMSQKYIRKKINHLFSVGPNINIVKNRKKNLSRNINNINNIYNSQIVKFKTSSEIKNGKKFIL